MVERRQRQTETDRQTDRQTETERPRERADDNIDDAKKNDVTGKNNDDDYENAGQQTTTNTHMIG